MTAKSHTARDTPVSRSTLARDTLAHAPEPAAHVRLSLHDTTLQSAVERAIELRARLEREVERRDLRDDRTLQLGSALDELSDAVCVTHPDGRIISANRAFHVLAGLGPLDTVSHLSLDALLCMDADNEPLSALFGRMEPSLESVSARVRERARPEERVFEASFSAMASPSEGTNRVVTALKDVTANDRALARAVNAERGAALGRLAAGLAHDLNSPLTVVMHALEALQPRPDALLPKDSDSATWLCAAMHGCRRIQSVVADLEFLTHADVGVVELRRAVEIAVRTTTTDLRDRARISMVDLDAPPALIDEGALCQVLTMLLNAALSAPPVVVERSRPVSIRLGRDVNQWPEVEVSFECAHTRPTADMRPAADTRRRIAYTREAIEALGGRLWVDRDDALRMRVRVALPPAPAAEPETTMPPRAVCQAEQSGVVLIVDDDDDLRESLTWLLEPLSTLSANSVEAARAHIRAGRVSAVLCDLQMPSGLGTELLAWVQVHAPALRDRFAIMTGGALTPGARTSLGQAEVPVLYKPFGREAVLALLSQLVSATP